MIPDSELEVINMTEAAKHFNDAETAQGWLYWMFLSLVAGQDLRGWVVPEEGSQPNQDNSVTIGMTINGKPVQFSKVVERLRSSFDDAVEKRAKAIVNETFETSLDDFTEKMDELQTKIHEFWHTRIAETRERRMEKVLLLIDGLCLLAMEADDPQPLVSEIYTLAHAAAGYCANPHKDWLARIDEVAANLAEMNVLHVERVMQRGKHDSEELLCDTNANASSNPD